MLQSISAALGSLPTAALIAIGALLAIQISLQVFSLIDLAKRPSVPGGAPKWAWALIIVFLNLLGAIAYLAVRRSAGFKLEPSDDVSGARSEAARRALDKLYGQDPPR